MEQCRASSFRRVKKTTWRFIRDQEKDVGTHCGSDFECMIDKKYLTQEMDYPFSCQYEHQNRNINIFVVFFQFYLKKRARIGITKFMKG